MSSLTKIEPEGGLYDGEVIIDEKECSLWYHPEIKLVHHCMHAPLPSPSFRKLLTRGAELLAMHKAEKWLSDDRSHKILSSDDSDWAENQWFPRARSAGFKYWGIALPTGAIGKLNINRFANQYAKLGVEVRVSDDPQEMFDWLKTCG